MAISKGNPGRGIPLNEASPGIFVPRPSRGKIGRPLPSLRNIHFTAVPEIFPSPGEETGTLHPSLQLGKKLDWRSSKKR